MSVQILRDTQVEQWTKCDIECNEPPFSICIAHWALYSSTEGLLPRQMMQAMFTLTPRLHLKNLLNQLVWIAW